MSTKYLKNLSLLTFIAICGISCSKGDYDFRDGDDAINSYRSYLQYLEDVKTSNTKDFSSELCKWREVNDTVFHYLQTKPEYLNSHNHTSELLELHDSVRSQMLRLAETWRYSYEDVLSIKEQTSSFRDDKELQTAVDNAEPFFLSLDSIPVMKVEKKTLLTRYKLFLSLLS